MWWYVVGIVGELLLLAFISRRDTQLVFMLLMRIVRSRTIAITIMTIILFPGTVIHELSHLFTAEVLSVHTGQLTLVPENIEENDIRSGSVAIAKTDPFRRTLIGTAPFINGIFILLAISWWFTNVTINNQWIIINSQCTVAIMFYLIFTITNTMFTSKEDMVGVFPVLATVALILAGLYFAGIRINFPLSITNMIQSVIITFAHNLGIIVLINLVGLLLFSALLFLVRKRS